MIRLMNQQDGGRIQFSLHDAIRLGYDYIKRRKSRSAVNIASIALGLSFYSSLVLSDTFYEAAGLGGTQAYQYWLVGVALIVSVVGITNAMLIAVFERYREIGTMKCLGALDQHIVMLFLVESSFQGIIGGVMGFLLGLVAAIITTSFRAGLGAVLLVSPLRLAGLFFGSVILAVFLSMAATMYPAWRASKLQPVEALNYEL